MINGRMRESDKWENESERVINGRMRESDKWENEIESDKYENERE